MKLINSLLLLFLFSSSFLAAQESKHTNFTAVIAVDSVSAKDLKKRADIWFVSAFKDSKSVIQINEDDRIIGKANTFYSHKNAFNDYYDGNIEFTISLYFKDGRYKYELKDFIHSGKNINIGLITEAEEAPFKVLGSTKKYRKREWDNIKEAVELTALELIASLKTAMNQPQPATSDDW